MRVLRMFIDSALLHSKSLVRSNGLVSLLSPRRILKNLLFLGVLNSLVQDASLSAAHLLKFCLSQEVS